MGVWERALGGVKYLSGEDFTTIAFNESTGMFIFRSKLIRPDSPLESVD